MVQKHAERPQTASTAPQCGGGGGSPRGGRGGGKGEGEEGGKLLTLVDTKLMVRMVATTAVTPNKIFQKLVKK